MISGASAPSRTTAERRFLPLLGAAVALGAVIRFVYVFTDDRALIGGDGFDYHHTALRLADGLGYTSPLGDYGAQSAHHPPGWGTLLGLVSMAGGRSWRAHQIVGVVIGLGLIAMIGFVGRRYFNARVGLMAAVAAAVYPGFWVIEGNILSEPLALLLIGAFTLAVYELRERPTIGVSVVVGVVSGLLALTRSEYVALLALVVIPMLLTIRTLAMKERVVRIVIIVAVGVALTIPWTIYNSTRFEEPVALSTNLGSTILAGNCPPATFEGKLLGYFDSSCTGRLLGTHPDLDRSQRDRVSRNVAITNIKENLDRFPIVLPARIGRTLALFRPAQTVDLTAFWMTTGDELIWAWVASFWVLAVFAVFGMVGARRRRRYFWPLAAPLVIVAADVLILYGEPRYHTPADLGVIVLAAAGVEWLITRREPEPEVAEITAPRPTKSKRLPSVYVPR